MLCFGCVSSTLSDEPRLRSASGSCTACVMCSPDAAGKKPEDQVFETMDATDLNKRLKDLMDGLSVKVC